MRRPEAIAFAAAVVLVLADTGAARAQQPALPPAKYEVRLEKSVMVPMRDGVKLSTDLYFPVNAGDKLATVLIRTPYQKNSARQANSRAQFFAGQGYVVAVQDVRGKYESEGEFTISGGDVNDGYDTDEWIAKQPWSTGKIGTYGCSYLGDVQMMQATARNPHVAAMIPQAAGSSPGSARNRYHNFGARLGGAVEIAAGVGWFAGNGSKRPDQPKPAWLGTPQSDAMFRKLWWVLPITDISKAGGYPPNDFAKLASVEMTDPWWNEFGYLKDTDRFDVPALHINSWYDFGPQETMTEWELFATNAVSAKGRDNQFAVIAPTTHCQFERGAANTIVGERPVGDARFDFVGLYLKWYDHFLRGVDNGVTKMPKVQYFLMGKGEWKSAPTWPLPGTQFTKFYLHGKGDANSRFGDGALSTAIPGDEPADDYTYDPATPTPSRGGPVCCTGTPDAPEGSFDQADVEMRNDVLVYTGAPLSEGIEVTGPLKAVLYVSSTARDTDFTAKLIDVYPDGKAYNVQEGILRARYRDGYDKKVFMQSGQVYPLTIDMQATGNYFPAGHRIRVEIASANFPRFDRNLNTGGNNYDETQWVVARNTIHHSAKYPSHLLLPVVPK